VLLQRGRGGGLAGALGGMGGQSAFGTRAGDTFTWITYVTAAIWILLATFTIKTFTDPEADRQAMQAEREEKISETAPALVPLDTKEGETTKAADDKENGTKAEGDDKAAPSIGATPKDDKTNADEPAPTDPPKTNSDKPSTPEPSKSDSPPADAPKGDEPKAADSEPKADQEK